MARAFAQAIEAGRAAYLAGPMEPRDMAAPSTPVLGKAHLVMRPRSVLSRSSTAPPGSRGSPASARGSFSCAIKDAAEAELARRDARGLGICRAGRRAARRQRLLAHRHRRRRATASISARSDLDTAPTSTRSARAGVRIGISTHDDAELERALELEPDYVALGPIYPTILKAMAFAPQGLERIGEWKRRIGDIPLVAIGGLNVERGKACLAAGADIVSVVTDITLNADPEARAARMDRGDARAVIRRRADDRRARIPAAARASRPT